MNEFVEKALLRGQVYDGNPSKIKAFMNKALNGGHYKIAFLGGSITMGCHATTVEGQYTRRVFSWFEKTFPNSEFEYLCAAVGGTDSQYGCARVTKQLLDKKPDFIFVEFAVNDTGNDFYKETYEGLIRTILASNDELPIMTLMNVIYNENGDNAQEQHLEVLKHYHIPAVSMKDSFYEEHKAGRYTVFDLTTDNIHPNDLGHEMIFRQLTVFLDRILATDIQITKEEKHEPITLNRYQKAVWLKNYDCTPVLNGFEPDMKEAPYENYFFIGGWQGSKVGDSFSYKFKGKALAIQFTKFAKIHASVAKLVVDGDEANATILDSNFDEDWGDSLYIQTIFTNEESAEHEFTITLVDVPEEAKPFYILSVIYYE